MLYHYRLEQHVLHGSHSGDDHCFVHTMPEYMDLVLAGKAACPAYDHTTLSNLRNSDVFQKLNTRFGYLFNCLSKYTGRSMNSLENLQRFNNTLKDFIIKPYLSGLKTFIRARICSLYQILRSLLAPIIVTWRGLKLDP
ncbi:hypothetical protein GQX74_010587 [Glossina fuscipes]|nr:hypothetical protein GQX74_010587 [Glossina fuscipes]